MQKIVIFDMDGTLIDSKKDITISINYVRELNHSLEPLSEAFVVDAINAHERNLAKMFYNTELYEERDRVIFEKHYKEQCIQNPYLYEGVEELLHDLKANDIKLSVATNAPTIFAQTMLESLKVKELFDVIIGADKVKKSKPHPDMLHHILENYNYMNKRDRAWMVGDNSKDMEAATNAQIDAIFAAWGFSSFGTHNVIAKIPQEVASIVL
ncbi:HAD family hydrolase [Sulfurimonas marina]|uniref:phosphoglycolate phosphatase n=1 Tax=Sulfurimonas marina TaxID=2590551 RepID=A0A7M1AUR9_9BACT|nr:HAD family hydrolase [Sulfurimonas marina]QOP41126.1 HAD family hydrolase [Sulfurimonas marina]